MKQISLVQPDKERSKLIETVQDVFRFLKQFAMLNKVKSTARLYLVKGPAQNIECEYSGVFQLYCYHLIFGSKNDSKILDYDSFSNIVQTLLRHCSMNYFNLIKIIRKVF